MLRNVVLNPCGRAQSVERVAGEIALLDSLRVLHHLPSVTGQIRPVNDEHAQCASPRGLFVLVGPAAVIGHRLALEKLFVL